MDHHRRLADDDLVFVVEELGEFGDGAGRQVSIVLAERDTCYLIHKYHTSLITLTTSAVQIYPQRLPLKGTAIQ